MDEIVLASSSPRRKELLERIGIVPLIVPADADERRLPDETVQEHVVRLAKLKALTVVDRVSSNSIIIGADTVVEIQGEWVGKPVDVPDAVRILRMLSGNWHTVWSGVYLYHNGTKFGTSILDSTRVRFSVMTDHEIDEYISTGESFDKTGAYGVQGIGARYVEAVEGCFYNVMGLPLSKVYRGLQQFGSR